MWKRGTLKEVQAREHGLLKKRILGNEVGQIDKVKDLDQMKAKLYANVDQVQN